MRSTRAAASSASAAASAAAKISDPAAADHEDDDGPNVLATTGGGTVGKEPEERGDEKTSKEKVKGVPFVKKKKVVAEVPMPPDVEDGDGDVSG